MIRVFEKVQRRFHPVMIPKHAEVLVQKAACLKNAVDVFLAQGPIADGTSGDILLKASLLIIEAVDRFNSSRDIQAGIINAMKAGRKLCQAKECLFGLRYEIPEVGAFFYEDFSAGKGIPGTDEQGDRIVDVGEGKDPYGRGRALLFVPGSSREDSVPLPLVVALHGGFGHGRDFLWTWLREARSRKFLLLAPTSAGMTWSIEHPETDLLPVADLIGKVGKDHPLDRQKILLTGFSDGGTFALRCSMHPKVPFSAFSIISGMLPAGELTHVRGRRVNWIHGSHDWMFPVGLVRAGCSSLSESGADLAVKILGDLAHAFPCEENASVLSWFDPDLA